MHRGKFFKSLGVLFLSAIVGCGGGVDRPKTIPVTGTVMYNGVPIAGAEVSFWNDAAPRAASGVTDPEGKFSLSMFSPNDGAIPGDNVITVTKIEGGEVIPSASPEEMLNNPSAMASGYQTKMDDGGPKSAVPAKYAKKNTSPLKENVSEENNQFVLQLAD